MIANTRSILVGLVLGAAQLSNASPADSPTDFSSPIYPTVTDSIPPLVKPTATQTAVASGTPVVDACAQKCIDAHDKCNTAPDANHATCAAEFAECLNYNPYGGDGFVSPTACSASSSASASATGAPIDACAQKCIDAHDKCDTAPDANHATCAAEFAECLNYNPYDGKDGTLVSPTACSASSASASATTTGKPLDACAEKCTKAHYDCDTAPDANHATCAAEFAECLGYNPYTGTGGTLVDPTGCSAATTLASATSKPTGGETSKPAPTETTVIVNGAERVSSVKVAGLVGAIGVAALAFL
ncbi:Ff.00g013260.m01.CDS01 [Fusarium sp. VM40]|nr:Ff.00g013260.m01.CDS01 [Fusarium sp. VM40]